MTGRTAGPRNRWGIMRGMASAQRDPRLVGLYVVLLLLLVLSGVLAFAGQPLYALLVLGVATFLNIRMLLLGNRLTGGPEE